MGTAIRRGERSPDYIGVISCRLASSISDLLERFVTCRQEIDEPSRNNFTSLCKLVATDRSRTMKLTPQKSLFARFEMIDLAVIAAILIATAMAMFR